MSTLISKKIYSLRNKLGLTRSELASEIDISENTLKGIEQRGLNPRFDVIEKIGKRWPEYAHWLVVSNDDEISKTNKIRIIDRVDSRYMDKCIIKRERLKKLIFIGNNSIHNNHDLSAIILIDNLDLYSLSDLEGTTSAIYIEAGNMNFLSNHGGKSVLNDFKNYLLDVNGELVIKSDFKLLNEDIFDSIYKRLEINYDDLIDLDADNEIYQKFLEWKCLDDN